MQRDPRSLIDDAFSTENGLNQYSALILEALRVNYQKLLASDLVQYIDARSVVCDGKFSPEDIDTSFLIQDCFAAKRLFLKECGREFEVEFDRDTFTFSISKKEILPYSEKVVADILCHIDGISDQDLLEKSVLDFYYDNWRYVEEVLFNKLLANVIEALRRVHLPSEGIINALKIEHFKNGFGSQTHFHGG